MSEHEWKPGDVAMVEWGSDSSEIVFRHLGGPYFDIPEWMSAEDGCAYPGNRRVRPLVVIDPEDRVQVERLRDLMDEAYCAQNDGALDLPAAMTGARGNALQAALRALANPTPEPLPEPTDPAVRVVDRDHREWGLVGGYWCAPECNDHDWESLWDDLGPLTIVTPDAPTPDADRPLKVGDQVFVALDAPATPLRERVCGVVMVDKNPYSVRVGYAGIFAWLHPRFLTLVSEATP